MGNKHAALRLSLILDGPLVENHRLPMSELQRLNRQLRATLRAIAIVLSERGPSGQVGRVERFIEDATDLRVVASPKPGSFALELEVPPDAEAPQESLPVELGTGLSERSVLALVEGLQALDEQADRLPAGFDRGVLRAVVPFRTTLTRGVSEVRLATTSAQDKRQEARIDTDTIAVARKLIKKPIKSHAVAEGTLQMVDFASLVCRVDRPPHASILCLFREQDRDRVQGAARQFVRVTGEGEFEPDAAEPKRIQAESIEIIYEPLTLDSAAFWEEKSVDTLVEEQGVVPYELPSDLDSEPWRDDEEAAALIRAIRDED